jgi:hypothetical protein
LLQKSFGFLGPRSVQNREILIHRVDKRLEFRWIATLGKGDGLHKRDGSGPVPSGLFFAFEGLIEQPSALDQSF